MQKFTPQDLTQLTYQELDEYENALNEEQRRIFDERDRRRALPFTQERETQLVKQLRQALGKPEHLSVDEAPTAWKKPTSVLDAIIAGDRVKDTKGTVWEATGAGIVWVEPGKTDPVSGEVWQAYATAEPVETAGAGAGTTSTERGEA